MSHIINQSQYPSIQIHLNSRYADAYGDVASKRSWCYFSFREPIIRLPRAYDFLISLDSAEVPCSMYAVNGTNNTITFNVTFLNGDTSDVYNYNIPITLANGNYSAVDIATLVSTGTTYADFFINASYNTNNNTFQFKLNPTPTVSTFIGFQFTVLAGSPNSIFGLSGAAIVGPQSDTGTIVINSDSCVDLAGTRAVFLKCLTIHTAAYDSRTKYSGSTLARIPIQQEPLGIVFWSNATLFKSKCNIKNLSTLEIQICDENGLLVDFNGLDWTCTIQLDVIAGTDFIPDQESNLSQY